MSKTNILSKEDVIHVAQLAKLSLSENEIVKFQNQLSEILNYMNALSEVDVSAIEPTAQLGNSVNVFREDRVGDSLKAEDALSQSGSVKDQLFKVDAVLE